MLKISTNQRQRVVDIYVSQLSGDGVRPSHYALHFDQLYHWYECVRLLTEAKFRHTALSVSLTYKLAVVLAQHFTPEVSEEHFEGAVPEANEHSVDEESSEHTVVEESSEHTAIEELVPGGYRGMCWSSGCLSESNQRPRQSELSPLVWSIFGHVTHVLVSPSMFHCDCPL